MRLPFINRRPPESPAPTLTDAQLGELATRTAERLIERALPGNGPKQDVTALLSQAPTLTPAAVAASPYPIAHWANPWRYTLPQNPNRHPGSPVTVDTLRAVADQYDILRACINHLKREVAAIPVQIIARDSKDDSPATTARIADAMTWFGEAGGLGGAGKERSEFEGEVIEDLIVVGASAVYLHPTRGGGVHEAIAIDAVTIRPRVDLFGWPDEEARWEQWVNGGLFAAYKEDQIRYKGLYSATYTPYYRSPVESLLISIFTAIKADEWNRNWLTDGTTVSETVFAGKDWNPDQIIQFSSWLNSTFSGDNRKRQQTRVLPAETSGAVASRKDWDFSEYELWLARRTCSMLGVSMESIGYSSESYKVSQEGAQDQTTEFGAGVLLSYRKSLYDYLLGRLGYSNLECRNVTDEEEAASERATRNSTLVGSGIKTINEARAEEGLDPDPDGNVLLVQNTMTTLELVLNPPEPVAPTTGLGTKPSGVSGDAPGNRGESFWASIFRAGGHWVTIDGAHVFIDGDGNILKGPAGMTGKKVTDLAEGSAHEVIQKGTQDRIKHLQGEQKALKGKEKEIIQKHEDLYEEKTSKTELLDSNHREMTANDRAQKENAKETKDLKKAHADREAAHAAVHGPKGAGSLEVDGDPDAAAVSKSVLGKPLTDEDYGKLTGAPSGSKVSVEADVDHGKILLRTTGDQINGTYEATLGKDGNGKPQLKIDVVDLKDDAPEGTGTRMLHGMVEHARSVGIKNIVLDAERDERFVGYYAWARLGFNGSIPNSMAGSLPKGLQSAKTIGDLMKTQAGRDWWKENGRTFRGTFDTSPTSRSSKVLSAYADEKGYR